MQPKHVGDCKLCFRQSITPTWSICFDFTSHNFCRTSKALRLHSITHRHECCNASIERSCAFFKKMIAPLHALYCNFGLLFWCLAGILLFLVCCTASCWNWRPLNWQFCFQSAARCWIRPVNNDCDICSRRKYLSCPMPWPSKYDCNMPFITFCNPNLIISASSFWHNGIWCV